ncbi:hypothetical protein [uncultured Megasphaera sp.]|uniref:hypothetical protein n=1 Tax=uncultured Megasphaera sp. TaxID=165188 RepID=UPI00265B5A66|nr:hypothetical protein [uncultured Megasphaera sp.]
MKNDIKKAVTLDERDDYNMIDRAAMEGLSKGQQSRHPDVPEWVNKKPITDDTRFWPVENNDTTQDVLEYAMDMQDENDTLRAAIVVLGSLLLGGAMILATLYNGGRILL